MSQDLEETYVLKEDLSLNFQFIIDYEKVLNPAQLRVVKTLSGPLLVIAGAGTGKTRTLIYRVARLIESGVPQQSILLLTFTRRAAEEMLKRTSLLLKRKCDFMGGTFHSFANLILRRYAPEINFPLNYTILDRQDSSQIIGMLRSELNIKVKERRFPQKETISEVFSKSINKKISIQKVIEEEYPQFCEEIKELIRLQELYKNYKLENGLMDYDDLLLNLIALLKEGKKAKEYISQKFQYILVDEYQDTNKLQAEIIRLLGKERQNIMVVGDDAQSIYAFRGANYHNIVEFPNIFPKATLLKLEQNYRSTQPILDFANALVSQMRKGFKKTLYTSKDHGPKPGLVCTYDEREQSEFVSQRVLELREEGIDLEQIAVLFRASSHSFDLEIELAKRNIPYIKYGGFKFMESAHIKDVLAYLRVIENPKDAISWYRILVLLSKIGQKRAKEIYTWLNSQKKPYSLSEFPTKKSLKPDLKRLEELLSRIQSPTISVSEKLQEVISYYDPILKARYDDYLKRKRDLLELLSLSGRYRSLNRLLTDLSLEPPDRSVAGVMALNSDTERLILSTVHSAKGLEWHTVFIIWVTEGRFPLSFAYDDPEAMEEELRLMYVATTRAKENLYLVYPLMRSQKERGETIMELSRFIQNIPSQLFTKWKITRAERYKLIDPYHL